MRKIFDAPFAALTVTELLSHKHWSCETEVVAIADVLVAVGVVELQDKFEKYVSFVSELIFGIMLCTCKNTLHRKTMNTPRRRGGSG